MNKYLSDVDGIKECVHQPSRSVIIAHRNPDGDAIGSSVGLKLFLDSKGHTVDIVFPSEYPVSFEFLPHASEILITDIEPEEVKKAIKSADLIWCLDFNALDRIDKTGEMVNDSKAGKILIDHHLDPEPFADLVISHTPASSTCELVFDMIVHGWGIESISKEIGTALMVGILTDTGSFSYAVSEALFVKAGQLLSIGVDYLDLQDRIFNAMELKHVKLLGHCLANRMEIYEDQQVGIIYLNKDDYKTYNIQRGDTEGIVNQLLRIKRVKIAVFVTEQPNIVKFSFRSKGDISVADICRNHFNGGGHKNASGGYMHSSIKEALDKVKSVLDLK